MAGRENATPIRLLELRQHLARLVSAAKADGRTDRLGQSPSGGRLVAGLVGRHPQVVLDLGVFGQLGGALLQQAERVCATRFLGSTLSAACSFASASSYFPEAV